MSFGTLCSTRCSPFTKSSFSSPFLSCLFYSWALNCAYCATVFEKFPVKPLVINVSFLNKVFSHKVVVDFVIEFSDFIDEFTCLKIIDWDLNRGIFFERSRCPWIDWYNFWVHFRHRYFCRLNSLSVDEVWNRSWELWFDKRLGKKH
jgi:hypothetical protein